MGDLFKGVHLLTQTEYNALASNDQLDPDVLYATPENVTELVRQHTEQIAQIEENVENTSSALKVNTNEIAELKTTTSGQSSEIVDIKNTISDIVVRDTNQDNRLTNIEENYATKTFVSENGGKIDKIKVNGVEQNIVDKVVEITVPDVSEIETALQNKVDLSTAQTITGPKTFTEHIYLANADGTVDRISHLNNNFIIHSGATNSAVLNIDEGLEKIYAFNNELAFKSDIAEAAGTTVYVAGTAVVDLNFSADPQTQINLLAEGLDDNKSELTTNINTKVSKSGDTMTGELIASDGVAFGNNKIRATNSGNTLDVVHVENATDYNVLNYTHGAIFTLNNSETPIIIQGSDDRPSYVSGSGIMNDLALESDITKAIDGLGTVFDLKGVKDTISDLPTTGNSIGDVWYVTAEEVGYIWLNDGTTDRWERFGAPIDLSGYATNEALASVSQQVTTNTNAISTKASTDALNLKASSDLSNVSYPQIEYDKFPEGASGMDGIFNNSVQTGAGDRVVESYISNDGNTWYRKWKSGWKECCVRINLDGALNTSYQITFPIEFVTKEYMILRTCASVGTGNSSFRSIGYSQQTKTGCVIAISDAVRNNNIYACGY